jgi:hypothetical protein
MQELKPDLKYMAIGFLKASLEEDADDIRHTIDKEGRDWWLHYHFGYGMFVRNLLRDNGFGEREFVIDTLDDYWAGLVEAAVKLPSLNL